MVKVLIIKHFYKHILKFFNKNGRTFGPTHNIRTHPITNTVYNMVAEKAIACNETVHSVVLVKIHTFLEMK